MRRAPFSKRQDTVLQQFSKCALERTPREMHLIVVETWNISIMDEKRAIAALGALAQETRLALFRLLVTAGPAGLRAGVIAERLGVQPSSLSFHLAQLVHAGLITQRRLSRQLIYSAEYGAMNALLAYLTENCCGRDDVCAPVCDAAVGCSSAAPKTTAA
jgi:DNA-binding transcriptional ArsR family regulator